MPANYKTYRPEGFRSVNPYLFAKNPKALIQFFKDAFSAEELNRSTIPQSGEIANSLMKIGDSCLMISQARDDFEGMRSSFYLFVENVDEVYKNALDFGAKDVFGPADMEYQDRQAGIIDPAGNYWWISRRLVNEPYRE
jgi:uncharacterized glyoxalase superfamily protein PhnB